MARDAYMFYCPHCNDPLEVEIRDLQCGIFRHAWYKQNGVQVPPHATRQFCEKLVDMDLIIGCGKPFEIQRVDRHNLCALACEYI